MEGEVQRLRRVCEAGSAIRSSGEVHARMVEEVAEKLLAEFARLEKEKTELEAQRVKLGEERARLEAMRAVLFSEGSDEQAAPAPPVRAPAASVVAAAAVAAAVRGEMVCWAGVEQTVRWTPSYVGYTLHFAEARPRRLFSLFVASSSERYEVCLDGTAVAVRVPGKLGAVREGYIRIDLVQPADLPLSEHVVTLRGLPGYPLRVADRAGDECAACAGKDGKAATRWNIKLLLLVR